jgi:hypothetical protein
MEILMKFVKIISTITLLLASALILPACAVSKPEPPPPPDALTLKIMSTFKVDIVQTSARQEGENVIVEGQVKRKRTSARDFVTGHIDIEILNEEGKALRQVVTDCSPKIIPKSSGMKSSFSTRIPMIAPQGSLVSVKFHNGSHDS